jgi:ribosome-binding ATPase
MLLLRAARAAGAAAAPARAAGRRGPAARPYSRSAGLVGLPNVGKSTLFNALVRQQLAQASNYPFTTIEPNVALVEVPDARLAALAAAESSAAARRAQVTFHDIAGLIAGASTGAGLGNAFLGNIRAVSVILHVVRCFDDPDTIHVLSTPDPVRDVAVIDNELVLADLQTVEKRLAGGLRRAAAKSPDAAVQVRLLEILRPALEAGVAARDVAAEVVGTGSSPADVAAWDALQLLTQKPVLYVCNVAEAHAATGNDMTRALQSELARRAAARAGAAGGAPAGTPAPAGGSKAGGKGKPAGAPAAGAPTGPAAAAAAAAAAGGGPPPPATAAVVCAKLEAEAAELPDADAAALLREYGVPASALDAVIAASAALLRTSTFYTSGPTESRAWVVPAGSTAPAAAGAIHSDMEAGYIKAEVAPWRDVVAAGGFEAARKAGAIRAEGRDYVVADGDVVVFKFAGGK